MLRSAVIASLVAVSGAVFQTHEVYVPECGSPAMVASYSDSSLLSLYGRGEAFSDFLENTRRRRDGWHAINGAVQIADSSLARARAVGGNFRVLVVAIDSCGDSMQQVPYVARLAELVPGLSLRIVPPALGAAVQQSHRSLDGRTATPTFVLLDESGRDVGCMVELPRAIREWTHVRRDSVSNTALHDYRASWYAEDKGASVVHEIVELMEAARAGSPVCASGTSSPD